jgi:hypothetical protein
MYTFYDKINIKNMTHAFMVGYMSNDLMIIDYTWSIVLVSW